MRRTRWPLVVALALLVVLAGCSAGSSDGGGDAGLSTGAAVGESAGDGGGSGGSGGDSGAVAEDVAGDGSTLPQVDQRAIIRTGNVQLEVDSYDEATTNLTAATEDLDGFVGDTARQNHRVGNETYATGQIVLRVPNEHFSALMAEVRAEGSVLNEQTNTEDVSDQLVDIEARLSNLRTQRDRLRELYEEANTTQDVLAVERRLSEVQTEIERLEARQESLERRVAYSTITVNLQEPRPTPEHPPLSRWYDTPVVEAFLESIDGVAVVLRALVVGFAFALPYLLVFGLPVVVVLGGVLYVVRRGRLPGFP